MNTKQRPVCHEAASRGKLTRPPHTEASSRICVIRTTQQNLRPAPETHSPALGPFAGAIMKTGRVGLRSNAVQCSRDANCLSRLDPDRATDLKRCHHPLGPFGGPSTSSSTASFGAPES
eukprot:3268610-Rhodomonas_salina.1